MRFSLLRHLHSRKIQTLVKSLPLLSLLAVGIVASDTGNEAPTGFTTPTNCPSSNLPSGIGPCANNGMEAPPNDTFALDQKAFEEQEDIADGLGPVYNDKSCVNCHQ